VRWRSICNLVLRCPMTGIYYWQVITSALAALSFAAGAVNVPGEFGMPPLNWTSAGWFFLTLWLIVTNTKHKE
jgi:hypothetical protein